MIQQEIDNEESMLTQIRYMASDHTQHIAIYKKQRLMIQQKQEVIKVTVDTGI